MIRRVLSAALLVRDAFTAAPFVSGAPLRCQLDGRACRPLWKPGGYLLLTDLEPGEHRLCLSCRGYRDETCVFSTREGLWEQELDMEPGAGYPFPRDAAFVGVRLTGRDGPAAGATVWAAAPGAAELRLAQAAERGSGQVRLLCRGPAERLGVPGRFIAAGAGKAGPELLRLREVRDETGVLDAPLAKEYPRGTRLLRARRFSTDAEGRMEAAFRAGDALFLLEKGRWMTAELTAGAQELVWKEE